MKVSVTSLVEHRSSAHQGLAARLAGESYMPLPGACSCCGSGCSSTSSCSCCW